MEDAPDPNNPLPPLAQSIVGGIARQALAGLGGIFATYAGLSTDLQLQLTAGGAAIAVWLAGTIWTVIQKRRANTTAKLAVATALSTPVPTPTGDTKNV